MKPTAIMTVVLFGLLTACDSERASRLEKENQELRSSLDLDAQAKCARDAQSYFVAKYHKTHYDEESGAVLDFTHQNHYNRKLGKCLITVYEYDLLASGRKWNTTEVFDVYGGPQAEIGGYSVLFEADNVQSKYTCEVAGKECKSEGEFKEAIKPYTEE